MGETHATLRGSIPTIGLVAALPPQIGGVPSFAEWLLEHEQALGCRFAPFDLWRPANGPGGGKLGIRALAIQAHATMRFLVWLVRAPRIVHYCVSANPTGLARDLFFMQLLRLRGRRTIAHIHSGTHLARSGRSFTYRWSLRRVTRLAVETVAISPSAASLLRGIGIDARVVLNPVRFVSEQPSRSHRGSPVRLLFVGSYGVDKGCRDLVVAVAAARSAGARVTLRFVGKEKYRGDEEMLRADADVLGLEGSVTFSGALTGNALRHAYADADVLCLPSYAEGLPMVVLEAMALGTPVLATRVGAIPDVVSDDVTGLLVDPGDRRALAHAITRVAADGALRERLAAAARSRALSLADGERIVDAWRGIYERLAGEDRITRPAAV